MTSDDSYGDLASVLLLQQMMKAASEDEHESEDNEPIFDADAINLFEDDNIDEVPVGRNETVIHHRT